MEVTLPQTRIHPERAVPRFAAPDPDFSCTLKDNGLDAAWVRVTGELDIATAPELERALGYAEDRALRVVLDLRELTFMDTSGIHAIVDASASAAAAGRRLVLVRGPWQVDRVLGLSGACDSVDIVDLDPAEPPIQALVKIAQREHMESHHREGPSVGVRVVVSVGAGMLSALVVAVVGPWWLVPLSGWDVAAVIFVIWMWRSLWSLDAENTARQARRENPRRAAADGMLIGASVASLTAVGLVLVRAGQSDSLSRALLIGLSVISIVLAWSVVHTVYSLRYAKLYYEGREGGVDFNAESSPCYIDFAYLALTIGMTFQVSDTNLQTTSVRRTALRHALLSYAFGTLIIATTINLVAGLTS
jgi:anti-anti-sigma factor